MSGKEARPLAEKVEFKFKLNLSFQIIRTAMNGPYLPITRKPKIIFSEWLENRKVHISKNKK